MGEVAECPYTGMADPPVEMCTTQHFSIAPDRHVEAHQRARGKSAGVLKSAADLMRLLRNRRLVFVGDSVTEQYERALACAVRAHFPGDGGYVRRTWLVPFPGLQAACRSLLNESAQGLTDPKCTSCASPSRAPQTFPAGGPCQLLGYGVAGWDWAQLLRRQGVGAVLEMEKQRVVRGFEVPRLNASVVYRFGLSKRAHMGCPLCAPTGEDSQGQWRPTTAAAAAAAPPGSPAPRASCAAVDPCADGGGRSPSHLLPSTVELAAAAGADVIVANYGLHYHTWQHYRSDLRRFLAQLSEFASAPGRVAVFRETSVRRDDGSHSISARLT